MILKSRWTVGMVVFVLLAALPARSPAQWGGFSFSPPSIDISPPKIGGELGKIGGEISGGAKHAGGVISGGAKHAGGVISSGAKHAGGVISSGAKHAGGVVSGGAKHAEVYSSAVGKHAIQTAQKHPGQVALGAMYPYYPAFHYAANWKPFPNATLGNQNLILDLGGHRYKVAGKGQLFGHPYQVFGHPTTYEIGIRDQTASDLAIDALSYYAAQVPGNPLLHGTWGIPGAWVGYGAGKAGTFGAQTLFKEVYGPKPVNSTGDLWKQLPGNAPTYTNHRTGSPSPPTRTGTGTAAASTYTNHRTGSPRAR